MPSSKGFRMCMVSYTQEQVTNWSSDCWYKSRYSGVEMYAFLHTGHALKNQVFYLWKLLVSHAFYLVLGNFEDLFFWQEMLKVALELEPEPSYVKKTGN